MLRDTDETNVHSIQAVERAFNIIENLDDLGRASASELADELDMAVSTVYIHLKTLTKVGYVVKSGNEYHLGLNIPPFGWARAAPLEGVHGRSPPRRRAR